MTSKSRGTYCYLTRFDRGLPYRKISYGKTHMRCRLVFQSKQFEEGVQRMRKLLMYLVRPMSGTMKVNLVVALTFGLTVVLLSFQPTTVEWTASETSRPGACSVTMADGRVAVIGGEGSQGILNRVDILAPDGTLSMAAPMQVAHSDHTCVTLDGGRILVACGKTTGGGSTSAAEVYEPAKNRWTMVAMTMPRSGATATLLNSGRVLIAGGSNSGTDLSSIEIFNPYDNVFEYSPATLSAARRNHAAALLPDGRVLLAGGVSGFTPLDSIDIIDPVKNMVTSVAKLGVARSGLSATTLLDGTVLLAGGLGKAGEGRLAELLNPVNNTVSVTSSLVLARHGHQALRLKNNNTVLIVGGASANAQATTVEQYIPWQRTFKKIGPSSTSRTPVSLNGVRAQATAASGGANTALGIATIQTDRPDYSPGMAVKVTGSGWLPGETVSLVFDEINGPDPDVTYTAVADASGNILNTQFVPDIHALGVTFNLTAPGTS